MNGAPATELSARELAEMIAARLTGAEGIRSATIGVDGQIDTPDRVSLTVVDRLGRYRVVAVSTLAGWASYEDERAHALSEAAGRPVLSSP